MNILFIATILTLVGVYKIGRETPTHLLAGYIAFIAGLGVYSRESYSRHDILTTGKGSANTP
jgi:hypothetical protein